MLGYSPGHTKPFKNIWLHWYIQYTVCQLYPWDIQLNSQNLFLFQSVLFLKTKSVSDRTKTDNETLLSATGIHFITAGLSLSVHRTLQTTVEKEMTTCLCCVFLKCGNTFLVHSLVTLLTADLLFLRQAASLWEKKEKMQSLVQSSSLPEHQA